MEIKKQIVKIIKDETPINVKFKGKEISCEIKESQFVEKMEKFIQNLLDKERNKIKKRIKSHLDYCQQQNGLPYCKNCGISEKTIKQINRYMEKEIEKIKELKKEIEELYLFPPAPMWRIKEKEKELKELNK